MAASTLTSKGQITIPAQVRRAIGVDTGDRIEFVELAKGQFAIMPATGTVRDLKGLIQRRSSPISIEEMSAAILRRAAGRKSGAR